MEKRYENIIYEKKENIATIILNRPKALNALNTALMAELKEVLEDIDENVRAIVITGAGEKAFCAGADISELLKKSPLEARNWSLWLQSITRYMESIRKPIIARINGFCLGGGLELAMSCDFRIASDKSRFGQPEINLAVIPGSGGTQRMTRLIGKTKAIELEMTGKQIDAQEAYKLNLVNKVVPVEQLDSAVDELIKNLLSKSSAVLGVIKLALNKGIEMDLDRGLYYEAECFGMAKSTEDSKEGLKAFLEKRKAEFKGM